MLHAFPYAEFKPLEIPEQMLSGVYSLPERPQEEDERGILRRALKNPVGSSRLAEQVRRGMRVTIAVDDWSRSTRTDLMLPLVLEELSGAGIPERDITVFIALGTHRQMSPEEMKSKYTPDAVARCRFVNPDWRERDSYRSVGVSSRNLHVKLHREILSSDYVIGVGQTIAHMIAGFGGGGKIINPGCADAETIGEMHWLCSEVPEDRLFAERENVVRATIDETAQKANLRFILNEVPGGDDRIAGAFAGDPVAAHREACAFAKKACLVQLREKADIVVADAYPADLDFWQAIKGLNVACMAVRRGGTVILVSPCPEGVCAQHAELTALGYIPVPRIRQMVAGGELDKVVAANLYLGRKLLEHSHVILVTRGISEKDTRSMGFAWAADPAEALRLARARHPERARINVLYKASKMICEVTPSGGVDGDTDNLSRAGGKA